MEKLIATVKTIFLTRLGDNCNICVILPKFMTSFLVYLKLIIRNERLKKCFNTASFRKINLSGVSVYMAACCQFN